MLVDVMLLPFVVFGGVQEGKQRGGREGVTS